MLSLKAALVHRRAAWPNSTKPTTPLMSGNTFRRYLTYLFDNNFFIKNRTHAKQADEKKERRSQTQTRPNQTFAILSSDVEPNNGQLPRWVICDRAPVRNPLAFTCCECTIANQCSFDARRSQHESTFWKWSNQFFFTTTTIEFNKQTKKTNKETTTTKKKNKKKQQQK